MNRLWMRLTLALVAVTLLGMGLISLLAYASTRAQLDGLAQQQRNIGLLDVVDALRDHHAATGTWDGADVVIAANAPGPRFDFPNGPQGGRPGNPTGDPNNPQNPGRRFNPPGPGRVPGSYVLADASGRVVYDNQRQRLASLLSQEDRNVALVIDVDGRTVGFLLATAPNQLLMIEAQQFFLRNVARNLGLAALIGVAVSTLAGLLISRVLTRPLDDLSQAARAFSARQWDTRAKRAGTQEVDAVAVAFNSMAGSLQQAETNRRNLTADIAHELRTPLTVVQGNLRAMLDGVYPMDKTEIATVYDETRLLGRLVDDLRELALAEAGHLALQPASIDTNNWLARTVEPLRSNAETRSVDLQVESNAGLPAIKADPDRSAQVLRNLLMNALRHTAEGGRVTVRAASAAGRMRISVIDTGEGIAAADLPHIFDRFYRADKSRARQSGGSGLGLPISKALVDAMGGTIGVSSTPSQGSSFWFELPLA